MKTGLRALLVATLLLISGAGTVEASNVSTVQLSGPTVVSELSPDGNTLYAGGYDGAFDTVDLATRKDVPCKGHASTVTEIAAGTHRVLSTGDKTVRIRDVRGNVLKTVKLDSKTTSCDLSPNEVLGVAGVEGIGAVLFTVKNGKIVRYLPNTQPRPIARFVDNRSVALATGYGGVQIWDLTTNSDEPAEHIFTPDYGLGAMEVSADGRFVATCGNDSDPNYTVVTISDIYTTEIVKEIAVPSRPTALAFRPDGMVLAIGTVDGSVIYYGATGDQGGFNLGFGNAVTDLSYRLKQESFGGIPWSISRLAIATRKKTVTVDQR